MSEESSAAAEPQPLRSKHTSNFPGLLEQLGISVLVTTYQAGKLVVLRSAGTSVNTHFRDLPRPMGMAADPTRLAVGVAQEIRQYRNMTPVCRRLEPPGRHDACYLSRSVHLTGDIDIHEMAWAGDELWFVNTRFSSLCTLNGIHSFVPRWRPPFVSALSPDDRCHLNGLAIAPTEGLLTLRGGEGLGVRGQAIPPSSPHPNPSPPWGEGLSVAPRWVTALAEADTPQGWRDHKKDGGVLIDVPSGNIIVRGLSMPHSPRWLSGQLWLLESGRGGLGYVDLSVGRYHEIVALPGFTRGLDIYGGLAFLGLSQVRESAVFSGIPIAERALAERNCGVWVVDLRTGQTVAFLRFEDAVQEVFAVQVLPGLRYPELAPEDPKLLAESYDLPSAALVQVPEALLQASRTGSARPATAGDRS
jgi:hypothetical protein